MNTKLLFITSLCALVALQAFGFAKGKDNVVTLGVLDPSLKNAEGTAVDAFTIEENRIEFDQPGVEKYDTYFKEVAIVAGTTTELRFVLTQINEGNLTAFDAKPVLDFGRTALPEMENKIPSLLEQAQGFKPSDDFKGMKKTKIPGVAAGLTKSMETLNSAATEIPTILEQLNALDTTTEPEAGEEGE